MILGAAYLAVKALMLTSADCSPGLTLEECNLEFEAATEMSRMLFTTAVGLLFVGAGVLMMFRSSNKGAA
jgi:hypothetical protein